MKTAKFLLTFVFLFFFYSISSALTVFSDSFDDNHSLSGWKRGSTTYITRNTVGYKVGDASMRINGAYESITYINTLPFKSIVLSFKLAATNLASGQYMEAYVDYGTGWVKVASKANGGFTSYSYNVPAASKSFKIRFRLNTTSTGRYGYVDDVVLTGNR